MKMRSTYLGSKSESDVVGWAYVMQFDDKPLAMITQLFVPPAHRGEGRATSILQEITSDADRLGIELILDFQPAEFNSDAVRLQLLYERFGFTWDETIGGMRRVPNR